MKVYKKSTLLLGLAILSGGTTTAETKGEIISKVMTRHERFFYGPNLFDRSLSPHDNAVRDREWRQALDDLQNYVDNNAGGNKKLTNAAQLVKQVGSDLVTTIMTAFKEVFSCKMGEEFYMCGLSCTTIIEGGRAVSRCRPTVKKTIYQVNRDYCEAKSRVARLSENGRTLQKNEKTLEDTSFYIGRQNKNDAKEVLLAVIDLLENTINRVRNDFGNKTTQVFGAEPGRGCFGF